MQHLTLQEIGKAIRKVRKERGLRLEDLADEQISPATVSNIERGISHVSPEKISYLLKKLNLSEKHLPSILIKEEQDLGHLQFTFLTITTLNHIDHPDEALTHLDQINWNDKHPMANHIYYHKGISLYHKQKWKQSERAFYHSLHLAQQKGQQESNTEAACYLYLGLISFKQNQLDQALHLIENGINAFIEHANDDQQYIKYFLHLNKIICLQKAQRLTEGMQLIQSLWNAIHNINHIEITIDFYILRAEYSKQIGLLDEAIHYATAGIQLAQQNKKNLQMFDLWFILGDIYLKQQNWDRAITCFQISLKQQDQAQEHTKTAFIYQKLGFLYLKQNQLQKAYSTFGHALDFAEKSAKQDQLTSCLLIFSDLCFSMSRIEEALKYCHRGLSLAEQNRYNQKEQQFLLLLARYWEGKNEKKFQQYTKQLYQRQSQSSLPQDDSDLIHTQIIFKQ